MTSVVQYMDHGIIKYFKHFYRQLEIQNILSHACLDEDKKIKINILQAAHICIVTRSNVKHGTNCLVRIVSGILNVKRKNEAARESIPTVDNWGDVGMKQAFVTKILLNMDEDLAVCSELSKAQVAACHKLNKWLCIFK